MQIDPNDTEWWRRAVFYHIYPRSYRDCCGEGTGDLEGIRQKLGYLCDLGVDAIWISPTFPSPMLDFGYDVADYVGVDPRFGTLEDMDRLIAEAHDCGIRVLLDWVPNHSSDKHPWFIESRSSLDNPRRDWYYWRDPKPDGTPPNNWRAVFGGPAWQLDSVTGQYYLHSFLKEQPDLNWRNPDVVEAMHETLRFWMRRGIDGFRIDVVHMILKHPDMPDNPPNPAWHPGMRDAHRYLWTYNSNYKDVFPAVEKIREVIDESEPEMAPSLRLLVSDAQTIPELAAHCYQQIISPSQRLIEQMLAGGAREAEFSELDQGQVAKALSAPFYLLALWPVDQNQFGRDRSDLRKTIKTAIELQICGLGIRNSIVNSDIRRAIWLSDFD